MRFLFTLVVLFLANKSVLGAAPMKRSFHSHHYYVVEHDPKVNSGASLADVARSLGVEVVERAGELENHWVVRAEKPLVDLAARGLGEEEDPVLRRFESLQARAASPLAARSDDGVDARSVVSSIKFFERQELHQRHKRAPPPLRPPPSSPSTVANKLHIQDPLFSQQWHIVNEESPENMMNVVPVWEMGITGKGVISTVVDDGLDYTSEDLAQNFSPENSWDFNDHEPLPYPKKSRDHHGTRCAGQIAAGRNGACGVGIAYDSKIAGVRILSSPISDVDEAIALNYGFQNVSIYSCSWGPPDNGRAMGAPNHLIKKAVLNGINNGRDGKGSIFVFASGNGGHHEDQCNYDGYTNSIYSVTVAAVDYLGQHPYYSETCAANMIVAYSSGSGQHIVTTDKGTNQCTDHHGGTSAAAPNAAGVFALAVQARPDLTWRDIQYLSVETAKMINPEDPDWETTAAGRKYSYKYGYGALDAYKFVTAAQKWKLVKPQALLETKAIQLDDGKMDHSKHYSGGRHIGPQGVTSKLTITKEMLAQNNFEALEHINVQVWIDHSRRGDVEVELISPNGVKSILGKKRSGDEAKTGFPGWVFMSVKHWGENPVGDWTIRVTDQGSPDESGKFLGWSMKFWGSTIDASKAEKYELPLVDNVLPPVQDPYRPALDIPNTTKEHPKPTAWLDSAVAHPTPTAAKTEHSPAHSTASTTSSHPAKTSESTFFSEVTQTVGKHTPFFGGIALIAVVGMIAGIVLWRQRRKQLQEYESLEEAPQMASLAPPYVNETETLGISPGRHPSERATVGLGFHSSFLDDEDLSTAGVASAAPPRYRDDPEDVPPPMSSRAPPPEIRVSSSRLSTDGSWDHTRASS